jgi:glycosyltransferase involved in cell wall biosynthesis
MKLKILNVLPIASRRAGGPPAFVGPAARELQQLGYQVRIVSTDMALAPGAKGQRALTPDELHPLIAATDHALYPARRPRRLAYSPPLAGALRASVGQFDVVHIHSLWLYPQYAAYSAASAAGVPYIVSPHGALDPFLRGRGRLRKRITTEAWQGRMLENARLIHVTSEVEAELIADVAPSVPRAVVPLGVDLAEFSELPERGVFRRERLNGYEDPVILFLGRLTFKKGIDLLIEAFARARRESFCRLVIAGPDDEGLEPSLRAVAERCGVTDDVAFVGPVYGRDRLAALACADIWALASHTENFGVAVVEAMASGLPVVISPAVNIAAEVAAAQAGIVAELTAEAFANVLRALLADQNRRRTLADSARAFAGRFEWRAIMPSLTEMYQAAGGSSAKG